MASKGRMLKLRASGSYQGWVNPSVDYRTLVLSHSPRSYWRLNEASPSPGWQSETAHGAGTYIGTPTPNFSQTGLIVDSNGDPVPSAIQFNTTSYAKEADPVGTIFSGTDFVQVEAWVKHVGGSNRIFTFGLDGSGSGWSIAMELQNPQAVFMCVTTTPSTIQTVASFPFSFVTGNIYYLVGDMRQNDSIKIYVWDATNGVYKGSASASLVGRTNRRASTAGCTLNVINGSPLTLTNAYVDEVAVYIQPVRLLSFAEMQSHFEAGAPIFTGVNVVNKPIGGLLSKSISIANETVDISTDDTQSIAQYSTIINADNPSGYWRLNESSLAALIDDTGNYNGTFFNSPTLQAAALIDPVRNISDNRSVQWARASQQYATAAVGAFNSQGLFTLETWFNVTDFSANCIPFTIDGVTINRMIGTQVRSTGRIRLFCTNSGAYQFAEYATPVGINETHHLLVSHFGSNQWLVCLDGAAIMQGNLIQPDAWNQASTVYIGAGLSINPSIGSRIMNEWMQGRLDEVAFYNGIALSEADALAHYEAGVPPAAGQGAWRELIGDTGLRTISISGTAVYADDDSMNVIEAAALAGSSVDMTIEFDSLTKYIGTFFPTSNEFNGDYLNPLIASLTLEGSAQLVVPFSMHAASMSLTGSAGPTIAIEQVVPNFYLEPTINASRITYSEGYAGNSNYPMAAEYREGDAFGTANIRVEPAINRTTMAGWWYWEWTVLRETNLLRLWLGLSYEANYPDQIVGQRPNSASHGNDGFTTNCTQSRRYVENTLTQPWTAGYCYNQGDVIGMSYKTNTDELWTSVNGNAPIQVFQNIMGLSNLIYITATFQDLNLPAGTGDKLRFNAGKTAFAGTPHAGSSALEGAIT